MTGQELGMLLTKIKNNIIEKDYDNALTNMELYLSSGNARLSLEFFGNYLKCLIMKSNKEKAKEVLEIIMDKYYEKENFIFIMRLQIMCGDIVGMLKCLKEMNDLDSIYYAAKLCLEWRYYDTALDLFKLYIPLSDNGYKIDTSNEYIRMINNYKNTGEFITVGYDCYKMEGNNLSKGDIVYFRNVKNNIDEKDYQKYKRPYVVWKVEDGIVYVFSVVINVCDHTNILKHEDYPNLEGNSDRRVKRNLKQFKEYEVCRIIGKLTEKDNEEIFAKIYTQTLKSGIRENKPFMDDMVKSFNIQNGDIISIYEKEGDKYNEYYVINSNYCVDDKKYYSVIKIEDGNFVGNPILFKSTTYVSQVKKLSEETKEDLNKKLVFKK